jgi:hypothetical protein
MRSQVGHVYQAALLNIRRYHPLLFRVAPFDIYGAIGNYYTQRISNALP